MLDRDAAASTPQHSIAATVDGDRISTTRAGTPRIFSTLLAVLGETLNVWTCVFAIASGAALLLAGWAGKNLSAAAPAAL